MRPTFTLMLLAIIGSGAYLALAVLGWGGFAAFFSHPPLVALTVVLFALTIAALFSSGNLSAGVREDRSNRWVLTAFAVIGVLIAYLPAYMDRIDVWTIDGAVIRWIGVILFAVGGALRLWPVFTLGRRFSGLVAIQPDHKLVTDGVFRIIRNPSYLGLMVSTLGWALAFRSVIGICLTALMLVPLIARIRAEEALLESQFGEEYAAYRQRTWRLIPGLY